MPSFMMTISAEYFLTPTSLCVCLYAYPIIVVRQRFGKKNVIAATDTRKNIRIVGRVVFYAVRVI
jgi:hypothetical protein